MKKDKKIKILSGTVVSDKMQKTVVVAVTLLKRHPKYGKQYKVTNRYKAHDEKGQCHIGDKVEIIQTRPISKQKSWRVVSQAGAVQNQESQK